MIRFLHFQLLVFIPASAVPTRSDSGLAQPLLRRKREHTLNKSILKDDLVDFGLGDWYGVAQGSSFPELSSCNYDLEIDCCLAEDSSVSLHCSDSLLLFSSVDLPNLTYFV